MNPILLGQAQIIPNPGPVQSETPKPITPEEAIAQGFTHYGHEYAERLTELTVEGLKADIKEHRKYYDTPLDLFAFKKDRSTYNADQEAEFAYERLVESLAEESYEDADSDIENLFKPEIKGRFISLVKEMTDLCNEKCPCLRPGPPLDISGLINQIEQEKMDEGSRAVMKEAHP